MSTTFKEAFDALSSALTVTNLNSLASSPTAGWNSDPIDNTTNLYSDILIEITLDPANTAPANSKAFFIYAYAGEGSLYESTGAASSATPSGAEGALTYPDVTANPCNLHRVGVIAYVVADVPQTRFFTLAQAFGGIIPPKWGLGIVNHSGAALAASGNTIKWRGVYATGA